MMGALVAVDLGASSGRVVAGRVVDSVVQSREIARFSHAPVQFPRYGKHDDAAGAGPLSDIGRVSAIHWDLPRLWQKTVSALRTLENTDVASIGVDTWGVDYGFVAEGEVLGAIRSYRDQRTEGVAGEFVRTVGAQELYQATGLQMQTFNTIFQLLADGKSEARRAELAVAEKVLLLPDLLNFLLCGAMAAELTNASTTGLIDPVHRTWNSSVIERVGQIVGQDLGAKLPDLVQAGNCLGYLNQGVAQLGTTANPARIINVASHDTASAVIAAPLTERSAYISCGTWSLVGVELDSPVVTEASRKANFTNELGIDGTVRYLKNIMGMWVFNGCLAQLRQYHPDLTVVKLSEAARSAPALRTVIDINHPVFTHPGDMCQRIQKVAQRSDQPVPETPAEIARCVVDSLALAHARAVKEAATLANVDISSVTMVGGGIKNTLLCQLTADACGCPVTAGPVEATATGNLLIQARAHGDIGEDLSELRNIVRSSFDLIHFEPESSVEEWRSAERRVFTHHFL